MTKACGTAACATAVASSMKKLTENNIDIKFKEGILNINIDKNLNKSINAIFRYKTNYLKSKMNLFDKFKTGLSLSSLNLSTGIKNIFLTTKHIKNIK